MSPRSKEANQQVLDRRREEILSAALKVFARRGFVATKISDIAEAAGLSHGLMYHYFKTKEEVFTELFNNASTLKGISEYITRLKISPWEKIKSIVEMTLSLSFEGDGLYYWNIVNQAFISDAIPEDVKKRLKDKKAQQSDLILPLIIEGQKLGQIAPGDPVKLDMLFRATLNGLALQIMREKNMPDYKNVLPDADMIMRLLARTDMPSLPQPYERQFGPVVFAFKKFVYRLRDGLDKDFIIVRSKITRTKNIYRIESERETGEKSLVRLRADSSKPLSREFIQSDSRTAFKIEYRDHSVRFNIPGKKIDKEIKLDGEYYDGALLMFDLQGFPFESSEKVRFRSVSDGSDGSPVGPFGMEGQKVARETITVPAGRFDCYKLEILPGGLGKSFGETFKYYFWFAADEPHFWVKSEDKRGYLRELVKFK